MTVLDEAQSLARQGRMADAVAAIESAARDGDGQALVALAHWRIFGLYGGRDLELAHALLRRAQETGSREATRLRATLIANGTGCRSDPDAAAALLAGDPDDSAACQQLHLLSEMRRRVADPPVRSLCDDPPVRVVEGLLTAAECLYIIAQARPELVPSVVIDPRSGRKIPNPIRTSAGMNFGPTTEDPVIHAIVRRIAAATGTDSRAGEPLQILRYLPGQEYRPHLDTLGGAANQRIWTAIVYLNSDYSGGETRFDRLALDIRGAVGDALIFRNVTADGAPDPRTRHAGLPVSSGEKWLATRWIRQTEYDRWQGT